MPENKTTEQLKQEFLAEMKHVGDRAYQIIQRFDRLMRSTNSTYSILEVAVAAKILGEQARIKAKLQMSPEEFKSFEHTLKAVNVEAVEIKDDPEASKQPEFMITDQEGFEAFKKQFGK